MSNRWTDWLPRVVLKQLFVLVAIVAASLSMLRFPNALIAAAAESMLCLLAILAVLIAMYGRRASRAFWVGGLIAGFLFFSLAKGSLPLFEYRPDLVTSQLNVKLFAAMYPENAGNVTFNPYSLAPSPANYYLPPAYPYNISSLTGQRQE